MAHVEQSTHLMAQIPELSVRLALAALLCGLFKALKGRRHQGLFTCAALPALQLHFYGEDTEVNFESVDGHKEYKVWSWMPLPSLPPNVVESKRGMYEQVGGPMQVRKGI
eukprot:1144078-Pelagomonas_calceolata.AAC.2